jgi:hypothetical protein
VTSHRLRPIPPKRRRRVGGLLTSALVLYSVAVAACGGVKDSPSDPTTPTGPSTPSTPTTPSTPSSGIALNDDFSGRTLFPFDNWWNQDISRAPLDGQSNAFIDYIGRTRTLHPDFGPPLPTPDTQFRSCLSLFES